MAVALVGILASSQVFVVIRRRLGMFAKHSMKRFNGSDECRFPSGIDCDSCSCMDTNICFSTDLAVIASRLEPPARSRSRFPRTIMGLALLYYWMCLATVGAEENFKPQTYVLKPSADVQFQLQTRLIDAVPGDVIQLEAGEYRLQSQLDVAADNITIRGRGPEKTILSFRRQTSGGQGIEATGNNFVLEGLAVENTAGNAVKVLGAKNVTIRNVRVEWTAAPIPANGAYGIYPVQCQNVLLEGCTAIGASDAGLYVGQCRQVVVRSCRAERNVAGIEIENTVDADVYDNIATNNTGGVLVFDMPGLQLKAGRNARVFHNQILSNNHRNFADQGAVVAAVPTGTGVMVLASDHVEVFENEIRENQSSSVLVASYLVLDKRVGDTTFDPFPEFVSIHDNHISEGGKQPTGQIAELLKPVLGERFPDMLWDGVVNPATGKANLRLVNNGEATFVNFDLANLTPENIRDGIYKPQRELKGYDEQIANLPPVSLDPHLAPSSEAAAAVRVYRSLPDRLSEFGLFTGEIAQQQPANGVVPYALNTALFSDYSLKRRFIRIPPGTKISFRDEGVLEFPDETVIAKTFSYPDGETPSGNRERLLETRIELRREGAWYGASYRWNNEQDEAHLVLGGDEMDVAWIHEDGKPRNVVYQIPHANQCLSCHRQEADFQPLGPTAQNLNREALDHAVTINQLTQLADLGWLDRFPKLDEIPRLPQFEDPHSASLDGRARAWLAVNCAHCHNPIGSARTSGLDLSWEQSDPAKLGVWKSPVAAGHGSGNREYDIVPGEPDASIIVHRMESQDPSTMMPNVGRRLVHSEAVALVREWIEHMRVEVPAK